MKFKVMQAIFRLLVLSSVTLGALGCTNCGDLDCVVSDELWVQILSAENGESLTDGNDPPINESNFYCYREEEDGGRKQINLNRYWRGLYMQSDLESGTYYYSALSKTDTVEVFGYARNTKCCGRIFEVDSIRVNGQVQELLEITLYR